MIIFFTQDFIVIIGSIVGFLVFFALHIVVFRHIQSHHAVRWFFILICGVGFTLGSLEIWGFKLLTAELAMVSVILFLILSCCYFMGVFGLLSTSVRIRILCEIASGGTRGVTLGHILARYNRKVIVRQRLARLLSTGDIVYDKGTYVTKKSVTFFVFPAFLLRAMTILYGQGINIS